MIQPQVLWEPIMVIYRFKKNKKIELIKPAKIETYEDS